MSGVYQYNKNIYFPNGINIGQLHYQIENSVITKILIGIYYIDDLIRILFSSNLDDNEIFTLEHIIGEHYPKAIQLSTNTIQLDNIVEDFNSQYFTTLSTFTINSTLSHNMISKIIVVSNIRQGTGSYDIRIFNKTYNNIVATGTFSNNIENINCLNLTQNIPTTISQLELQGKVNNPNMTIDIRNISIFFHRN